jgi:hypothetical protein
MKDNGISDFILFKGYIQHGMHAAPISFRARVGGDGQVEFEFDTMSICEENRFITEFWEGTSRELGLFVLSGSSDDTCQFHTQDLSFTSLNENWNKDSSRTIKIIGGCTQASFRRKLIEPRLEPEISIRLKGFQNFGPLIAECPLGMIKMVGETTIENPNMLTGQITIKPKFPPASIAVWRSSVDKLLDHIVRVMSLASAVVLHAPVTEYYIGDEVEIVAWSQTRQAAASMRTIHYLHQQPFFSAAVRSHFHPPFEAKNLFYAIEWFAMDATYNEVRLLNAMTVLENLVAANLFDDDSLIRPKKEFEKTRRALRKTIKECLERWPTSDNLLVAEVTAELNEKLGDLNRRSILTKLKILADRWAVPLDGISQDQIKSAKRARDLIVHRGHYYDNEKDDENNSGEELWSHVVIVREVVIRFLFTAIDYKGHYISFVGGMHHTEFPPNQRSALRSV